MARHAAPTRYRWRWVATAAVVVVAAVVAVVALVGLPGGKKSPTSVAASTPGSTSSKSACPQRLALRVVAASGIAPVVRDVASRTCVQADITTTDDSAKAASLLKAGKADVWIPDSRVRAIVAGQSLATSAPSVAVSPIVIAANSSLDTAKLPTKGPLSWSALLNQGSLGSVKVEIQNSATSSTPLVVASTLKDLAVTAEGDKYLGLASTAIALFTMKTAGSGDIAGSTLRIEEARLAAGQPNTKILDMAGGYPQLDYPWLARSGADATVQKASSQLLQALQGPLGDSARKQNELLKPGTIAVEPGDYPGARSAVLMQVPAVDTIPTLYAIADAGAQHGNTLAVLDISGSMADPTGPGQPTKMQAVQSSARLAAQLLSPQTRMGLWEFTYLLDPPRDYRQVVPMAPLSTNRTPLLDALNAATPIPTGGTSLYRTVVEAYKFVQANWRSDLANSIIVFTDGKDESDPGAPSLADVQAQLKSIEDPAKPIQLIMFGYGQADIAAMNALTGTVGGVVYHIQTPTQIVGAFIDAISHAVLHSLGA